jgi:hypothetical protein
MVSRTLLSLFSYIAENAGKIAETAQKPAIIIDEMRRVFEIFLRGIAREGLDRSYLLLPGLPAGEKKDYTYQ